MQFLKSEEMRFVYTPPPLDGVAGGINPPLIPPIPLVADGAFEARNPRKNFHPNQI